LLDFKASEIFDSEISINKVIDTFTSNSMVLAVPEYHHRAKHSFPAFPGYSHHQSTLISLSHVCEILTSYG
jgi:predicted ester cyclase